MPRTNKKISNNKTTNNPSLRQQRSHQNSRQIRIASSHPRNVSLPSNQEHLSSVSHTASVNSKNTNRQSRSHLSISNNIEEDSAITVSHLNNSENIGSSISVLQNSNLEVIEGSQMEIAPNTRAPMDTEIGAKTSAGDIEPSSIPKSPVSGSSLVAHLRELIKVSNLEALKQDIQTLQDPTTLKNLIGELESDMDSIRHSFCRENNKITDARESIRVVRGYIEQGNKFTVPFSNLVGNNMLRKLHEGMPPHNLIEDQKKIISSAEENYENLRVKMMPKFDVLRFLQEQLKNLDGVLTNF